MHPDKLQTLGILNWRPRFVLPNALPTRTPTYPSPETTVTPIEAGAPTAQGEKDAKGKLHFLHTAVCHFTGALAIVALPESQNELTKPQSCLLSDILRALQLDSSVSQAPRMATLSHRSDRPTADDLQDFFNADLQDAHRPLLLFSPLFSSLLRDTPEVHLFPALHTLLSDWEAKRELWQQLKAERTDHGATH